jgi:hypothetical protein
MNLLTLIPVGVSLLLAGFNAAIFIVVKFNDLKHQEDSLKRIEEKLDKMDVKIDSQGERIACLEGKMKTRKR